MFVFFKITVLLFNNLKKYKNKYNLKNVLILRNIMKTIEQFSDILDRNNIWEKKI